MGYIAHILRNCWAEMIEYPPHPCCLESGPREISSNPGLDPGPAMVGVMFLAAAKMFILFMTV